MPDVVAQLAHAPHHSLSGIVFQGVPYVGAGAFARTRSSHRYRSGNVATVRSPANAVSRYRTHPPSRGSAAATDTLGRSDLAFDNWAPVETTKSATTDLLCKIAAELLQSKQILT